MRQVGFAPDSTIRLTQRSNPVGPNNGDHDDAVKTLVPHFCRLDGTVEVKTDLNDVRFQFGSRAHRAQNAPGSASAARRAELAHIARVRGENMPMPDSMFDVVADEGDWSPAQGGVYDYSPVNLDDVRDLDVA